MCAQTVEDVRREEELIRQTSLDGAFFLEKRTFMRPRLVFLAAKEAFLRGERGFLKDKDDPLRRGLVEVAAAALGISRPSLVRPMVEQICARIAKRADALDASNLQEAVEDIVASVLCKELYANKAQARKHIERMAVEVGRVWVQVDRAAFASVLPAKPLEGLKAWYR